jgi:5-methylcytosine-specific restriction endonuclease McrA
VETHEEERKQAARERSRRWTQRHPEYRLRRNELDRHRYHQNRDSILARNKIRYAGAAGAKIRASNAEYYARNRERIREQRRRKRAELPEHIRLPRERERNRRRYLQDPRAWLAYQKRWRQRNPERSRSYVKAAQAKRRQASGGESFTAAQWLELLARHDGRCAYCGDRTLIEPDHRIPLVRGGSNSIGNILPACRRCNRRKNDKTEEEFRELLQRERRQGLGLGLLEGNAGTTRS